MSAVEEAAKALHRVSYWCNSETPSRSQGRYECCAQAWGNAEALAEAGLLRVDGETRTEWGIHVPGYRPQRVWSEGVARDMQAEDAVDGNPIYPVVSRERTTYSDTVTPWVEVPA